MFAQSHEQRVQHLVESTQSMSPFPARPRFTPLFHSKPNPSGHWRWSSVSNTQHDHPLLPAEPPLAHSDGCHSRFAMMGPTKRSSSSSVYSAYLTARLANLMGKRPDARLLIGTPSSRSFEWSFLRINKNCEPAKIYKNFCYFA